jgi:DNA-binding MarR family transcriptional regulator
MQQKTSRSAGTRANPAGWTFLTNHMHILVVLGREPDARIRDLAEEVGITQRAVQRILAELTEEKILKVSKDGRRNTYSINRRTRLRHPLENRHTVGELLDLLG